MKLKPKKSSLIATTILFIFLTILGLTQAAAEDIAFNKIEVTNKLKFDVELVLKNGDKAPPWALDVKANTGTTTTVNKQADFETQAKGTSTPPINIDIYASNPNVYLMKNQDMFEDGATFSPENKIDLAKTDVVEGVRVGTVTILLIVDDKAKTLHVILDYLFGVSEMK